MSMINFGGRGGRHRAQQGSVRGRAELGRAHSGTQHGCACWPSTRRTDFTQFRAAAALLAAPSQNLIYADTSGNIGYQLPGVVPLRSRSNGQIPSPGWDPRYDWRGTIPFAELPYVYNPPVGYIVAANQPIIGPQYPYPLGSAYSYGWRSQEIIDRLRDTSALTVDYGRADLLRRHDPGRRRSGADPAQDQSQRPLGARGAADAGRAGTTRRRPDSPAAAYFNVIFHNILKLTFRDELPEDQWPHGGDRWYAVVDTLLAQPRDAWWDDVTTKDKVETRDDILLAAMTNARKEITSLMARDTDEWQWGRLHTVTLRNSTLGTSGIPPVERLFNRGDYQVGGGPADRQRDGLRRHRGLHGDQRADHADAGRPGQSRRCRAGSTRAASPATPTTATTTTRPSCGRTARCGRSCRPGRRWRPARPIGWNSSSNG